MLEGFLLFSFVMVVLPFVVMVILHLSTISFGVNYESLIFSCSHLFFSSYEPNFFLCTFFSESVETDQVLFGTYSLNEWIPWSRETIQGGHNNIYFFYVLFDGLKLFLDLSNPYEVGLHGLWVLYIHILYLIPQCHLLIDVLSFKQLHQSNEYFLRCLQGWHMRDEVILNRICNDPLEPYPISSYE